MSKSAIIKEFWDFLKERKRYWLLPIVLILVILSLLIVFAQTSAVAPFIYTLFQEPVVFKSDLTRIFADYTRMVADKNMQKENKPINENLLYRDLSYSVIGCFYEVYNELGPAHKEQVYHEALKLLFDEKGLNYESKKRIPIKFRGRNVGIYEPDFVVDDKIIIETKSVLNMPKVFENQLYYYLKGSPYRIGFLVNFGNEHIDIRRRVFDGARTGTNPRKSASIRDYPR